MTSTLISTKPLSRQIGIVQENVGVGGKVLQNTAVQLAGRGVSLALSFATSVLLARYLGRERMGEYGAIFAYLALFSFLATFSLEPILAREASRRRSEATQIFHTGMLIALSFGLAGAILATLFAPLFSFSGRLHWLVVVAALDMMLVPALRLPGIVFQVDMKQWFAVAIGLLRQVLWLVALVLLVLKHSAFTEVIIARTACGIIEGIICLKASYRPGFLSGARRLNWAEGKGLLRYSYPLALGSVAAGIFQRIDQLMLHKMTGDHALGPYVVAVQLTEQFGALPVMLIMSLAPVLSVTAGQEELFRHYLRVSFRFLMAVVFFVCAVITPITGPAIALLYGKEFLSSANLINVLIWSEAPLFLGVVVNHALIAKNLQRYIMIATAAGAIINISLNLVAIPRWGALGASWATVISYSVAAVFAYLIFPSSREFAWLGLRIALPPLLVAVAISVAMQHWQTSVAVKFFAAVSLYALGAWLTGTVRKSDTDQLKEVARRALKGFRSPSV